jgi:hypothetical protein
VKFMKNARTKGANAIAICRGQTCSGRTRRGPCSKYPVMQLVETREFYCGDHFKQARDERTLQGLRSHFRDIRTNPLTRD